MMRRFRPRLLLPIILILSCSIGLLSGGLSQSSETVGGYPLETAIVHLVAAGDIILHSPIVNSAWDEQSGNYDFEPIFQYVEDSFSRADVAVAVLETVLGGPGTAYTGYPRFNSPPRIADALQQAGVDVVFTAHNHSLDQGMQGVKRTVEYLDEIGLAHVGSSGREGSSRILLREAGGIRFAFLSYTASTNGLPLPNSWAVNMFDPGRASADIATARRAGAEIVVCALHSGIEYQRVPGEAQRIMVEQLVEAGADIVLGSHPHVIQPVEFFELQGPSGPRNALVAYSLGNLLSNQRWRYSDCGLMLSVTVKKEAQSAARVVSAAWQPLWVQKCTLEGKIYYRILPVGPPGSTYNNVPNLTDEDRRRLDQVWLETQDLLGSTPTVAPAALDQSPPSIVGAAVPVTAPVFLHP